MNLNSEKTDFIVELSCNVDDMSAEQISFAMDRLFEGGARDVYTIPIGMKKSRTGMMICVMCTENDKEKIVSLLFKHTTTIGIRETIKQRYILNRRIENLETSVGTVRRKISEGYGAVRMKYEYDDLAEIAKEKNISLSDVITIIDREINK